MSSTKKDAGKSRAPTVEKDEDEDLDDLDDVLQDFSKPVPKPTSQPTVAQSKATTTTTSSKAEDDLAFERELMQGMEQLMAELAGGAPGAGSSIIPPMDSADDKALKEAWEKLMIGELEGDSGFDAAFEEFRGSGQGGKAQTSAGASDAGKKTTANAKADDDFQKAIRQTMEKLRSSDDTAKADAANSADPMAQLLAALGDIGGDDGEGGDVQGMLESMMSQLMSKELLYEPLKELHDKFPDYLAKNASTLPPDDLKKYKTQQECVAETVKLFEDPSYSDDKPEKTEEVMKLMNRMQALGSPPAEIMGDLPPGFALGADGMPSLGDGEACTIA